MKVSVKRCGRSARSICREGTSAAGGSPRYRSEERRSFSSGIQVVPRFMIALRFSSGRFYWNGSVLKMQFFARIEYTIKDYTQFQRVYRWHRSVLLHFLVNVFWLIILIEFLGLSYLILTDKQFASTFLVNYLMLLCFITICVLLFFLRSRASLKKLIGNGEIRFNADETTIIAETDKIRNQIHYSAFCDFVFFKDTFYLFLDKKSALIIPKRCFLEGDPEEFRTFFSDKTGIKMKVIKCILI